MADLLITHGYVVTMDPARRVLSDGAVAITGRDIVAVGPTDEVTAAHTATSVIDARGALVLPGLVDAHRHPVFLLYSLSAERGNWPRTAQNGLFSHGGDIDALIRYCAAPFGAELTPDEAYTGALAEFAGLLRSGVTCFNDGAGGQPDAVAQAATDIGIRGIVARHSSDLTIRDGRLERVADTDAILTASEETVARWHGTANDRLRAWHFVGYGISASDELWQGIKQLAAGQRVSIGVHVAAVPNEAEASVRFWGRRPLTRLRNLGLFGPNLVTIHNGFGNDEEIGWMAADGVKSVHCPGTSMRITHGIIAAGRIPRMTAAGVVVGLGTDSASAGDMQFQLAAASGVHKDVSLDQATLDAPQVLEMATIDGASVCLWEDQIGSLEAGKRADMAIVDRSGLHWEPDREPVRAFVQDGQASDVRTVLVDGRVLLEDGVLTTVDEERLIHDLRRAAAGLAARMGG